MLDRFFGIPVHSRVHVFGLFCFAVGLPLSKVILSLSLMILIANLLLQADFKTFYNRLKNNKFVLPILIYYCLHLLGLLWSSDLAFGLHDVKAKLSLLLIPLIFVAGGNIHKKDIYLLLTGFTLSVLITSILNVLIYNQVIGKNNFTDIRQLSRFGSHIRYGIMVGLSSGILLYFISQLKSNSKYVLLIPFFWLAFYTYYSQIISGLISFLAVLFLFLIIELYKINKTISIISFFILTLTAATFVFYIFSPEKKPLPEKHDQTALGNAYTHQIDGISSNYNKYEYFNICESEIKKEWNKVSQYPYDSLDLKGQPQHLTLIRYMSSMGLRKDSVAFQQLKATDIQNIEKGIANINETRIGFTARIEGLKYQLTNSIDPNGHSLLQRFEYWKTAWKIIQKNWLIGVGTGDVQLAFDAMYEEQHSKLKAENRLRAHNSYLTNWISLGLPGLFAFLLLIIVPLQNYISTRNTLGLMFMLVAILTFFLEDTLETQMGISFFAFFYGLFSFERSTKSS